MQTNIKIRLRDEYPRLCFAEIPILSESIESAFRYDMDSDTAIVIPLFYSETMRKYKDVAELSVHGFCKRAMWLASELLNWTDLREQGVTLYIAGTQKTKNILTPYLKACGFPDKHVLWTDTHETDAPGHLMKFPLMKEALKNPDIKKVISFDASVYFLKQRPNNIFSRMKEVWTDAPISNFYPIWQHQNYAIEDDFGEVDYKRAVKLQTLDISENEYYQGVADLIGISVENLKDFWNKKTQTRRLIPEGRTQGYTKSALESPEFSEFFDAVKKLTYNDMTFTCLYWQKYLGKMEDIVFPKGVQWYPFHPEPVNKGNIGFLDSSKSIGETARTAWIERYK